MENEEIKKIKDSLNIPKDYAVGFKNGYFFVYKDGYYSKMKVGDHPEDDLSLAYQDLKNTLEVRSEKRIPSCS